MTPPRLSVVMPVYNGRRYLDQAVESILNQTLSAFEFIILDDASTDDSWQRLSDYAARDPRIRLERNAHNLGVRRTLNKGFALARGDYLARQDADDLSAPERLAAQVAFLEANPEVGLVGALVRVIDVEGAPLDLAAFPEAISNEQIQQTLLDACCICHGSVVLRRRSLDATGFYDEEMEEAEDYDLWLRLAETSRLANLPQRLYSFRYYSDSVSSRRHPKVTYFAALAVERAIRRRYGPNPSPEQLQPVARAYLRAALASHSRGESAAAQQRLARARQLDPGLLGSEAVLAGLLAPYTSGAPVEPGLAFVESVFNHLLPSAPHLARLNARLASQLHMREVFAGAASGDRARVQAHLMPGVRGDPAWLANRGVLSLLVRGWLTPGRRPG